MTTTEASRSNNLTRVVGGAPAFVGGVLNLRVVIELAGDQIKPAPEFSSAVDSSHVVGIGTIRQAEHERMLILVDIERLMSGADMGLANADLH